MNNLSQAHESLRIAAPKKKSFLSQIRVARGGALFWRPVAGQMGNIHGSASGEPPSSCITNYTGACIGVKRRLNVCSSWICKS